MFVPGLSGGFNSGIVFARMKPRDLKKPPDSPVISRPPPPAEKIPEPPTPAVAPQPDRVASAVIVTVVAAATGLATGPAQPVNW